MDLKQTDAFKLHNLLANFAERALDEKKYEQFDAFTWALLRTKAEWLRNNK